MKARDLRDRSTEDLAELERSLTGERFQNKFKNFTNRLDDTSVIRKQKRDLARVKLILTERSRGITVIAKPRDEAAAKPKPRAAKPAAAVAAPAAVGAEGTGETTEVAAKSTKAPPSKAPAKAKAHKAETKPAAEKKSKAPAAPKPTAKKSKAKEETK
jgi:large subunit ribosomal protein L29